MAWRDQLQPASFRGVPFLVESHSLSGGRRVNVHEYPQRDEPYPEDNGKKSRSYNIVAFVLGDDYIAQRDALIDAFEQQGPATLVHRYFGSMQVQVSDFDTRESNREGGFCRITFVCHEAGADIKPLQQVDTVSQVSLAADNALTLLQTDFEDSYQLSGFPGWLQTEAQTIMGLFDDVFAGFDVVTDFVSLVSVPGQIASTLISQFQALPALFSASSSSQSGSLYPFDEGDRFLNNYRPLFSFGDTLLPVPSTTPSRLQQSQNQTSLVELLQQVVLIEAARQASKIVFESHQSAIAVRDELADELDDHMLVANDDIYDVLNVLRVAVVNDLSTRAADLRRIQTFTPNDTVPALLVAHQLYQDANRDSDIVTRNSIAHPGFITGGTDLEVLNA